MKFIGRKITAISETVGERLSNARKAENVEVDEVARQTGIKEEYLRALEENDLESLPGGLYRESFLKKYSEFLGLDWKKIKKEFVAMSGDKKEIFDFSLKKMRKRDFLIFPKILRNTITGIMIVAFFIYIGFYLKTSLSAPEIEIIEPAENLITGSDIVTVIGKTDIKTQISINGRSVLSDENGFFKELVNLKKGINIITIDAQKKHGVKKTIERQILVE